MFVLPSPKREPLVSTGLKKDQAKHAKFQQSTIKTPSEKTWRAINNQRYCGGTREESAGADCAYPRLISPPTPLPPHMDKNEHPQPCLAPPTGEAFRARRRRRSCCYKNAGLSQKRRGSAAPRPRQRGSECGASQMDTSPSHDH